MNIQKIVETTANLARLHAYYERCKTHVTNNNQFLTEAGISYARAAMKMTERTMQLQRIELVQLLSEGKK